MDPGGIPHYFGPYPNWANSPMPMGNISNITVDNGGRFYIGNAQPLLSRTHTSQVPEQLQLPTLSVILIQNITVTNGGTNYTAPVVIISGTGTGATATAHLRWSLPERHRKFVDTLPGLNPAGANNLGQYIPVAQSDTTSYPGSDYYEIAVVQFPRRCILTCPNTSLRGYVQISTTTCTWASTTRSTIPTGRTSPTPLGVLYLQCINPTISDRSSLPITEPRYVSNSTTTCRVGSEGNLIIPVDTTVMGAGMGPQEMNTSPVNYTQNRATLHLHGGATPWISDGTPYQWITPANEYTSYPQGVSVYNVPDMPDAGARDGSQTFFYTNQQSARLMFYHDHSHGITRLNVYAGEASGYLVTDPVEQSMMNGIVSAVNPTGAVVLPGGVGIPLVIQDRTWVDANTIAAQDPDVELGNGSRSTPHRRPLVSSCLHDSAESL